MRNFHLFFYWSNKMYLIIDCFTIDTILLTFWVTTGRLRDKRSEIRTSYDALRPAFNLNWCKYIHSNSFEYQCLQIYMLNRETMRANLNIAGATTYWKLFREDGKRLVAWKTFLSTTSYVLLYALNNHLLLHDIFITRFIFYIDYI